MRGLIIDYVRHRGAAKRGGELTFTSLEDHHAPSPTRGSIDPERLGGALEELAAIDSQLAELVDSKFFCGFSLIEIAGMRGVSERTVRRDWTKARTLLHQSIEEPRNPKASARAADRRCRSRSARRVVSARGPYVAFRCSSARASTSLAAAVSPTPAARPPLPGARARSRPYTAAPRGALPHSPGCARRRAAPRRAGRRR